MRISDWSSVVCSSDLFHYLVMQTGRDLLIGQLFREFRDWHAESQMSIEALLTDLNRYARIFAGLVAPQGNAREIGRETGRERGCKYGGDHGCRRPIIKTKKLNHQTSIHSNITN